VSLRRLRAGELVALAGAVAVFVALGLSWYTVPAGTLQAGGLDAWKTFDAAVALMILGAVLAVALALAILTERSSAIPMATVVWSTWAGIAALISAIVRVLERPDHASGVAVGGWLGLAGAVAILAGSWQSMRDERTSLHEPIAADPARVRRVGPPGSPS
jgi:hypothetical protein